MAKIKIAGLDGSLVNFGVALMTYDTDTNTLTLDDVALSETKNETGKKVRMSSDNLRRCQEHAEFLKHKLAGCTLAFAEVPTGGQSAKACIAFGMVIGLYASLPMPVIEVAPAETKLATVGTRTASKEEMIDWATTEYPDAPWLTRRLKGQIVPVSKNEHLADAAAVVHAGIKLPSFKQVAALVKASALQAA